MKNLVKITEEEFGVILDIRYAKENNVCKTKMYADEFCYLHQDLVLNLKKAISLAADLGYKLKIWDGFRPLKVQQFMYDKFPTADDGEGFVSNPTNGAIPHCRGVALDLTLTDMQGNELDMGTDFDDFSPLAFHGCQEISTKAQKNRFILLGIMSAAGFDFYSKEWWHYQVFKPREFDVVLCEDNMVLV